MSESAETLPAQKKEWNDDTLKTKLSLWSSRDKTHKDVYVAFKLIQMSVKYNKEAWKDELDKLVATHETIAPSLAQLEAI